MNRRRTPSLLLALLLCLELSGCGGQSQAQTDAYAAGSDFQFGQEGLSSSVTQAGENSYYILHNGYVYFLDEGTDTILPLCNRADCLHDQETEEDKQESCNAYIGESTYCDSIAYCNGWIYCIYSDPFEGETLYRISDDGAQKEQVYQWDSEVLIEYWAVHRDVLYACTHSYATEDGQVTEHYAVEALPLTGTLRQSETIYEPSDELEVITLGVFQAYGSYLYFQLIAYQPHEKEITDGNYTDYMYCRTFVCHLTDGEIQELTLPGMGDTDIIQGVTFWQDQILLTATDMTWQGDELLEHTTDYYLAELDGSDPEVLLEGIPAGDVLCSDGAYLYQTNANVVAQGLAAEDALYYKVYDADLSLADTFTLPYNVYGVIAVGDPERQYTVYYTAREDEDGEETEVSWGVLRWDKSGVGSYQGGELLVTKIPYAG